MNNKEYGYGVETSLNVFKYDANNLQILFVLIKESIRKGKSLS